MVDMLIKLVEDSMNVSIQTELGNSSRMKDMIVGRKEIERKKLVFRALAFRHYLRVKTPTHRIALTHIVLSGHALAMEQMWWPQCGHPGKIDKRWRLCHFCYIYKEDAAHALLVCTHPPVVVLRSTFMATVLDLMPGLIHKHSNPRALFQDLLSQRSITPLLVKLAHDVLEVFYATEMLHINPEIRRWQLEDD
jgi:hypothetical protein